MNSSEQIIMVLREAQGTEVSSHVLCARLGVSRTAVWKQVKQLREKGYIIDACSRRGYRLISVPDRPYPAEVLSRLTTQQMGRDCRYVDETDSTNRDVAALALAGTDEGVMVVAGQQVFGKGRMTRAWFSPPDVNLYFSLLLRPDVELSRAVSLPLLIGLAVAEVLSVLAPELTPLVKWPNDILIDGRKACGILCEMHAETDRVGHIIAGVGLNVNMTTAMLPAELRGRATSLQILTGRVFSRVQILAAILNRFEPYYKQWRVEGFVPFLVLLAQRDALFGKRITLKQGGREISVEAKGVQADGALLLATAQGLEKIYSGETHIGLG